MPPAEQPRTPPPDGGQPASHGRQFLTSFLLFLLWPIRALLCRTITSSVWTVASAAWAFVRQQPRRGRRRFLDRYAAQTAGEQETGRLRRLAFFIDVRRDALYALLARRSGYFSPDWFASIAILLGAVLIGLAVYATRVRDTYVELYQKYHEATVAGEMLAVDPSVPPAEKNITAAEDKQRLFRSLQLVKLHSEDDTLAQVDQKGNKAPVKIIYDALYPSTPDTKADSPQGGATSSSQPITFTNTPTARLIVHLVFNIPGADSGKRDTPDFQEKLAQLVAAVLAEQPGATSAFRNAVRQARRASVGEQPPTLDQLLAPVGTNLRWTDCFVFQSDDPPPMTNLELIASLYQLAGVDTKFGPLSTAPDRAEQQGRLKMMTKFLETLVERIRADRDVKHAAKGIPLWKGYEQCAMWIVFFWTFLLLIYRSVRRRAVGAHCKTVIEQLDVFGTRRPEMELNWRQWAAGRIHAAFSRVPLLDQIHLFLANEMAERISRVCANFVLQATPATPPTTIGFREYCKEVRTRESGARWFLRWLAFALPAIGFIGTKRGIAGALSQADIIVRAQDPGAQATAISTVTSILGIAFTTTLIALVMGLITSLINSAQMHMEAEIIDELEQRLVPLLEPERARQVNLTTSDAPPDQTFRGVARDEQNDGNGRGGGEVVPLSLAASPQK